MKKTVVLFLTDLTIHANEVRPTLSFDKAIQKAEKNKTIPRIYNPTGIIKRDGGKIGFRMPIPQDLLDQVDRGEINLMLAYPKAGLSILADRGTMEKVSWFKEKLRKRLIHIGRVFRKE